MTVYILGGGPAGLALAHGLTQDSNASFVLLERGSSLGGLAQTIHWSGNGFHDLGPHKIFTLNQALMARVECLLSPEDWLTRPKKSSIFIGGYFLPYPPSPFSLIQVYGLASFSAMVFDYGLAQIGSVVTSKSPLTFEADLQGRVGTKLYEALFKPIALKLWDDPAQLDVKLSQGRVQTPSLMELVKRSLKMSQSSNFEALEFRYPKGGLQKLWQAIATQTSHQGEYRLNQEVCHLTVDNNTIRTIRYRDRITGSVQQIRVNPDDWVVSTLPLLKLTELMGEALEPTTTARMQEIIQLNDLILVFLKIDQPSLLDESWVFVPDPNIVFHRLSEQESFDPQMTPGGSIICCEVMGSKTRAMSQRCDSDLIALVKQGLKDMGYKRFSILDQRVIRLPSSYPVYKSGFEPVLDAILSQLDRFANFRTIGRQGSFNYIGTLDAMDIGYGAAQWLIRQMTGQQEYSWKQERERTSHYPVLD